MTSRLAYQILKEMQALNREFRTRDWQKILPHRSHNYIKLFATKNELGIWIKKDDVRCHDFPVAYSKNNLTHMGVQLHRLI